MSSSKSKPRPNQIWTWSHTGVVYEIVLLTRSDDRGNFYGIMLYNADDYDSIIGQEVSVERPYCMGVSDNWQRIT